MHLIISGDWHLARGRPRSRKDDYFEAQKEKIEFILRASYLYSNSHMGCMILQPGDFCDWWEAPDKFKVKWLKVFKDLPRIISVPGQHDMRYHTSDISNTPLGVLKEAIGFRLLHSNNSEPVVLSPSCNVYGAGWGKDIPKVVNRGKFNILITHRMIAMGKLWAGQESYEVAGTFLRKYKDFDLVVSGDNHHSFHYKYKDRWLINCGSLMRSKIDQGDHKPCIWVFDTETRKAEKVLIPVKPFKEVVNLERAEYEKEKNKKLEVLAQSLKKKSRLKGLNYTVRVFERVKALKKAKALQPLTEKIIGEIMGDG